MKSKMKELLYWPQTVSNHCGGKGDKERNGGKGRAGRVLKWIHAERKGKVKKKGGVVGMARPPGAYF